MKTTMTILALFTLIACAKPSESNVLEQPTQGQNMITARPSRDLCLQIKTEQSSDFMIQVDSTLMYLVKSQIVYSSDFKTLTRLETSSVSIGGYCTLEVEGGVLKSVQIPDAPTCGGLFQPACPPPQPTPYPCGPNGQMCF